MCKISCPVCNPVARRRRRRHLDDTRANAHIVGVARLLVQFVDAKPPLGDIET